MTRKTLNLMSCLVLLSATAAFADEQEQLVEKVAVRNRLHSLEKRWEAGANFGLTLMPRMTDHYNLNLSGAYNILDWLALELRGGYAISRHTSLANQIQEDFYGNTSISKLNDAADLWEMTGHGVIGLRFQPIYGKINMEGLPLFPWLWFTGERIVHFQLYLWAGAGAGYFKQESLVFCAARSSARECGEYWTDYKVSPIVSLALGWRFFIGKSHSLKFEVRDWSFLDSYYVNVDRSSSAANDPKAGGAQQAGSAGITNLVQLDIGYSFIF